MNVKKNIEVALNASSGKREMFAYFTSKLGLNSSLEHEQFNNAEIKFKFSLQCFFVCC